MIKQAQQGNPQYITVHGKPTAVIVSIEDYQKLNQPQTSLSEALMIPLIEQDLDLSYTILGVRRNTFLGWQADKKTSSHNY